MKAFLIGLLLLGSFSSFARTEFQKEGKVTIAKSTYLKFVSRNGVDSEGHVSEIYKNYDLDPNLSYMIVDISGDRNLVSCTFSINGLADYSGIIKGNSDSVYIVPMKDNVGSLAAECFVDTVGILADYELSKKFMSEHVAAIAITPENEVIKAVNTKVINQKPYRKRDIMVMVFK